MNKLIRKFKGMLGVLAATMVLGGLLIPATPAQAANPAAVWINPAQVITTNGASFDVTVNASTTTDVDTVGFNVNWTGPVGTLTCTGIDFATGAGSFFAGKTTLPVNGAYNPTTGTTAQYALGSTSGAVSSGSGPVATLHFTATANGQVNLSLADVQVALAGASIDADVTNGAVYVGLPDLVITSVSEEWITAGSTYNISYTIKNQGTAVADNSSTEIKIDNVVFQTDIQGPLAVGASETHVVGPVTFSPDNDAIVVTADKATAVFESNETNNTAASTWSNNRIYVDNTSTTTTVNTNFDVKVNLASMDPVNAAGFRMTWDPTKAELLSVDEGTFFSSHGVTMHAGPTIGSDGSMTAQYTVGLQGSNTATGDARLAVLHMKARSTAGAIDLNFEDVQAVRLNGTTVSITEVEPFNITISMGQWIDVEAVSKSERFVTDNSTGATKYYVDYTVRNNGNKAVNEGCTISAYQGKVVGSQEPTYVKLADVFWLGAGGTSTTGSFGPFPVPQGTYNIKLFADSTNNAPADINKANNIIVNTLGALPNLAVINKSEIWTTPGHYKLSVVVKNWGPAAAIDSLLSVSVDGVFLDPADIPALASGASATIIYPATGDMAISGQGDTVVVMADSTNLVQEWNETDNSRQDIVTLFSATCSTPVSALIVPKIEITCPGPIENWYLQPGDPTPDSNILVRTYNIKSNIDWQCEAEDNSTVTAGYMTAWDGSNYGSIKLSQPLQVGADATFPMTQRGVIKTGTTAGQDGMNGENFDVTYTQPVSYNDPANLPNGSVYHMVVNFIAGLHF